MSKLNIKDIIESTNVAMLLDEDELKTIASDVHTNWEMDKASRAPWEERSAEGLKLALQVVEEKTFPWMNASNVKFPIVTIAALQFQSRAYPALLPSTSIVKARPIDISNNQLVQSSNRISEYMSFQLLEEDTSWEKHMDEALLTLAIVGCAFKKSYFDTKKKHNVSEHILSKDLYIPYYAKDLESASRITQMLYVSKNDMHSYQKAGLFLDLDLAGTAAKEPEGALKAASDEIAGQTESMNDPEAPCILLEQHCYLDLDDDGYQEPYIVTIDKATTQVLRIKARFFNSNITYNSSKEIESISPIHYFTKYTFIPSPDGGIYDLGFTALLGPLNESINTVLNQLIDAGTLSNTAGGFLGRGTKFKSGENSFTPFEWKRVDSTGDDIRKGVFPLPVREPSMVLFQLLGTLINYGERVGMATDPQVGINPGQNTPAETSRNTIAEGQKVFNAIYKRVYRALKEEFQKLFKLNALYLEESMTFTTLQSGEQKEILRSDFSDNMSLILPAADPQMVTSEQKLQQAQILKMAAAGSPGLYNTYEVEKNLLLALGVENYEQYLPDPKGPNAIPPAPDTKVVIETMKIEQKNMQMKIDMQVKMFDLMQEVEYLSAEIAEKESRAALNLAQAEGVKEGHQIAALQSAVSLMKQKQETLMHTYTILKDFAGFDKEKKEIVNGLSGGMEGMEKSSGDTGMV